MFSDNGARSCALATGSPVSLYLAEIGTVIGSAAAEKVAMVLDSTRAMDIAVSIAPGRWP